jgi:hypothetical protein
MRWLSLSLHPDNTVANLKVIWLAPANAPLKDSAASGHAKNITITKRKNMSTKSPECYATDPKAKCLRVEIAPGHSLLLHHDDFAFAELQAGEKEQSLRMVFAEHEVMIRGYCQITSGVSSPKASP